MKRFVNDLKDTGKELRAFLMGQKRLILFTALTAFLAFGALLLYSGDILTDSETYATNMQDTFHTFVKVGRFGIVLSKKIFSTNAYVPFVFAAYTMISMSVACLLFDFCVAKAIGGFPFPSSGGKGESRVKSFEWFFYIFNALYLTNPIFAHQFYFRYQAFEVSLAFCFCIAASFCAFQAVYEEKSPLWCLPSVGFMIWGFATYQVLVPYYIAINAALFVLYYLFHEKEPKKSYLVLCLQLVALFLTGLVAYLVVSKVVIMIFYGWELTTHLADTYSCWGRLSLTECLANIEGDIRRVIQHEIPVFSRFLLPIAALFMVLSGYYGLKNHKKGYGYFAAAVVFIPVSIFLMTLLLGNQQIVRAQMVYPFVFAVCAAVLTVLPYPKKRLAAGLIGVFMLLLAGNQLRTSDRYYETMHITAVQDKNLAQEIYGKTSMYRDPENPGAVSMVFIGRKESVLTSANVSSFDALGLSFFDIDHDINHGSVRIARLMTCLGLETGEPTQNQYQYAVEASAQMNCYPAEGSILFENGTIIVKLSELGQ